MFLSHYFCYFSPALLSLLSHRQNSLLVTLPLALRGATGYRRHVESEQLVKGLSNHEEWACAALLRNDMDETG